MTTADQGPRAAGAARVRSEKIISLEEANLMFPAGRRPTVRRLMRWAIEGKRGILLDTAKGPKGNSGRRKLVTSIEAVRRFRDSVGFAVAAWLTRLAWAAQV